MMRKNLLLAGIGMLVWASTAHAVVIRLAHPDIDIAVSPGEKRTGSLRIENPGDQAFDIKVYAEDWSFKETGLGDKNFFPAGTLPRSASKWLTLNPVEVHMAPFSTQDIHYTLAVPNDPALTGTYHSVIFYESLTGEEGEMDGARVMIAARIGTVVRIGIAGTLKRQGKVRDIRITPPIENKPAVFEVTFTNEGNVDIFLKGNFLIMDASGAPKARGELSNLITEGGETATRRSEWAGKLPPGDYDIIFTFDLGEGRLLTEERKISLAG